MRTDELDFDLPARLIATTPAEPRDAARLLVIHRSTGELEDRHVRDLPDYVGDGRAFGRGDLMVVNQSRVLPAYWQAVREATGGRVTGLYLDTAPDEHGQARWTLMLETRGRPQPGETLRLTEVHGNDRTADARSQPDPSALRLTLLRMLGPGTWLAQPRDAQHQPLAAAEALARLHRFGQPPLPPYIRKARKAMGLPEFSDDDRARYDTVYAQDAPGDATLAGSIAAPTAGLHFTPGLLGELDARGLRRLAVTLHVGVGTFLPVRSDLLDDHIMHAERYAVDADTLAALRDSHAQGRRRLIVGTTAVRTLESLSHPLPDPIPAHGLAGDTALFIRPDAGFTFRHTDALLTNFHLPRSTLIALVAALPGVGLDRLKAWYAHAIDRDYRFFSYGDAMLLL